MNYKGMIGIIIAGSLGITLMLSVLALAWRDKTLGDKGGEVMIAAVTGLVGALSYYMGSKNGEK